MLDIRARQAPSIAAYTYYPLESTADVLLTMPPTRTSRTFCFCVFCRQNKEPTSGLEPLTCSLRVSLSPLLTPRKYAIFQVILWHSSSYHYAEYRPVSPLLLPLLLPCLFPNSGGVC